MLQFSMKQRLIFQDDKFSNKIVISVDFLLSFFKLKKISSFIYTRKRNQKAITFIHFWVLENIIIFVDYFCLH